MLPPTLLRDCSIRVPVVSFIASAFTTGSRREGDSLRRIANVFSENDDQERDIRDLGLRTVAFELRAGLSESAICASGWLLWAGVFDDEGLVQPDGGRAGP